MRIRNRRLFQILFDTATAPLKFGLHLNRYACAMIDRLSQIIGGDPLNAMFGHEIGTALAGSNVDTRPLAI